MAEKKKVTKSKKKTMSEGIKLFNSEGLFRTFNYGNSNLYSNHDVSASNTQYRLNNSGEYLPYFSAKSPFSRMDTLSAIVTNVRNKGTFVETELKTNASINVAKALKEEWKNKSMVGMVAANLNIFRNRTAKSELLKYFNSRITGTEENKLNILSSNNWPGINGGLIAVSDTFMYGYGWGRAAVANRYYLTGRLYCADLTYLPTGQRINNDADTNVMIKSLFCVMVKKENMKLVRALELADEVIPPELLEIWQDEKFDNAHPLWNQYNTKLLTPYTNAGVKVVTKKDLSRELYVYSGVPKFKSIKARNEWIEETKTRTLDKVKQSLGIKSLSKSAVKTHTALMDAFSQTS